MILITGSAGGLGLLAGQRLMEAGHEVIFHARNGQKADTLRRELDSKAQVVVGDISYLADMLAVADETNALGPVDAVIHNAGVMGGNADLTADGMTRTFAVNVMAPYVLTARLATAQRHVYLSSSMHRVSPRMQDLMWQKRSWNASQAYSESKFLVTTLAFAAARLRPAAFFNAVDPGWVPTRMGGAGAPDDLQAGAETQVVLAAGETSELARLSGEYLHHLRVQKPQSRTRDEELQGKLMDLCRQLSGIAL